MLIHLCIKKLNLSSPEQAVEPHNTTALWGCSYGKIPTLWSLKVLALMSFVVITTITQFYWILFCGKVQDKDREYIHSLHPNFHITPTVTHLPSVSITELIFVLEFKKQKKIGPLATCGLQLIHPTWSYKCDTVTQGLIILRSNVHLQILMLECWMNNWSRSKMG